MGFLDDAKEKVQNLANDNPDKAEEFSDQGIEKGGDAIDGATGGKFSDKIDQGQTFADGKVGE